MQAKSYYNGAIGTGWKGNWLARAIAQRMGGSTKAPPFSKGSVSPLCETETTKIIPAQIAVHFPSLAHNAIKGVPSTWAE
jgi:hypothetical protein